MAQDGKVTSASNPPFGNGKGATTEAGSYSGAHDFVTDPGSNAPAPKGRDFTKENRPQSEARPEVVPNPQEIPAGGKILKADPGPVSAKCSGTAVGVSGAPKPFRFKG